MHCTADVKQLSHSFHRCRAGTPAFPSNSFPKKEDVTVLLLLGLHTLNQQGDIFITLYDVFLV